MDWPRDARLTELVDRFGGRFPLPELGLVRQRSEPRRVDDIVAATRTEMLKLLERAGGDGPIAVGVGSRGIAHLRDIVIEVVSALRHAGYDPFVVPAMGSHGGGTAAGQLDVLSSYGITEGAVGVPVTATMETTVIGEAGGVPVHVDRSVVDAGQAFLVSRIKPHTDFHGTIESGPTKMAAIGLGKQTGAQTIHARGLSGLRDTMPAVGRFVARQLVVGAIALVENEFDDTASITGLDGHEIGGDKEIALLEAARTSVPRMPFDELDVLIVDRLGKDVSGTGMDPNVIGRWMVTGLAEPAPPSVRCLVALDLTEASHGNAIGIGLADFAPQRLLEKVDLVKLYMNTLTSGWAALQRARLPMVVPTDREAVAAALSTSGRRPGEPLRLAWIHDTLHTRLIAVSASLWQEAAARDDLDAVGDPFTLPFDGAGNLTPLPTFAAKVGEPV